MSNPDSSSRTFSYDPESNVKAVTDEKNHTRSFTYNDAMWRIGQSNAASASESYGYNADGLMTSITNARNYTRTFRYTPRGEFYSSLQADSAQEYAAYTATGAYAKRTNPLGQEIKYVYDSTGRLTKIDYPTGTDTTFSYGSYGMPHSPVKTMVDATGTSNWTYNGRGQVSQFASPQGTMNFTYDSQGRRITMQEVGVGTTTYTYNSQGLLGSLLDAQGKTTSLLYDSVGRISRRTHSNGAYSTYAYDNRGRLTQIQHKKSDNTLIRSESYAYDPASNLTSKTTGSGSTTYGYDNLDQLTYESGTGYYAGYTYDANGNRLTRTVNGLLETYNCDGADKLSSVTWPGSSKTFSYDAAGRTIQATTPTDTTTYTYDYDDRLVASSKYASVFSYNGFNARTAKSNSVVGSLTYKREGGGVTSSLLAVGTKGITPQIGDSTNQYYFGDRQGSYSLALDGSQTKTYDASLDAFGNVLSQTGTAPAPLSYVGGAGYQEDSELGLKLLGHRYYDAGLGRFLTRDPVGDGSNWYAYAGNNPLKNIDPSGLGALGDIDDCAVEILEEAIEAEEGLSTAEASMCKRMGWQFFHWFMKQTPAVRAGVVFVFTTVENIGNEAQFGPVGGTMAHSAVTAVVKGTTFGEGVKAITEASYLGGKTADYGTKGSVRCDVIITLSDQAKAIFDYKFGRARLTQSRINEIVSQLPKSWQKAPVFKIPGGRLAIPR